MVADSVTDSWLRLCTKVLSVTWSSNASSANVKSISRCSANLRKSTAKYRPYRTAQINEGWPDVHMEHLWKKTIRLDEMIRQAVGQIARNAHTWQRPDALWRIRKRLC
jgi:hypothetical protein